MTILFSFYKDPERLSNFPKVTQQRGDQGCSAPQPVLLPGTTCLTEWAQSRHGCSRARWQVEEVGADGVGSPESMVRKVKLIC